MTNTTRKLTSFVLKLLVILSLVGILGSFGAYDAGNISLLRMLVQIVILAPLIFIFHTISEYLDRTNRNSNPNYFTHRKEQHK